jgi:hypothetical protein
MANLNFFKSSFFLGKSASGLSPVRSVSASLSVAGLLAALSFAAGLAHASTPAGIVGEVTLVIGSASLQAADGQTRSVERGSEVRVGDKVETQQGGHVHLRFVDGGRVSVRPASRLVIESYAHSKDQPQLSAIKFRLDEGVIRSITGTWGEAAKERFRLNTPVAAIGVKGTDFVVRSLPTGTAATVFAGAIVVSPLTEKCVGTLGPCINGNEKTLSESMKGQMLELQRPDASPQLVPAVDLQAAAKALYQSQLRMLAAGSEASKDSAKEANKVAANEATKEAVKDSVKDANFVADSRPMVAESKAAMAVTEASRVELPAAQAKELTWGRYAWSPKLAGDDFSKQFEAALMQGKQSLGGNGAFSLLRSQTDIAGFSPPTEGVAKFRLANASAGVIGLDSKLIEGVNVNQASLDVNFANATFATQLQLQAPVMGEQTLVSAGGINANGTLRVESGNTYLFGGFNSNGKEVGYLFQKSVPNGVLMGTTLWGR